MGNRPDERFYGVRRGRVVGVYDTWESCKTQVEKCSNEYRRFKTREQAEFYVETGQTCSDDHGSSLFAQWLRAKHPGVATTQNQKSGGEQTTHDDEAGEPEPKPKSQTQNKALIQSRSFFAQVPGFKPNPRAAFAEEFRRFALLQKIKPGSTEWKNKRSEAINHEIMFHYSQGANSDGDEIGDSDDKKEKGERKLLRLYQNMCREVNLEPLDTVHGCLANLKSVLVNITDYISVKREGKPVKVWAPEQFEAFRKYTLKPERTFSLCGKTNELSPLLQFLRREDSLELYQNRRHLAKSARKDYASRNADKDASQGKKTKGRPTATKTDSSAPHGHVKGCKPDNASVGSCFGTNGAIRTYSYIRQTKTNSTAHNTLSNHRCHVYPDQARPYSPDWHPRCAFFPHITRRKYVFGIFPGSAHSYSASTGSLKAPLRSIMTLGIISTRPLFK
ncbi:hypothetical protein GGR50DRAFT_259833 [Xylaria sp. CBS 124048]|nr:hypothetical protein GGR50DRAFT_259833 [Xylaria sp. CBS 124048]